MRMNRIVNHHTGGGYAPSADDLAVYHRLIDGMANVHLGRHPIDANAPGRPMTKGTYAPHTARLNTGAIGVAVCCMANGVWSDPFSCRTFPKPDQIDAAVNLNARLCVDYGIPVTRQTVLSHAEVPITLGVPQAGKWDFDYDPTREVSTRDPVSIGDAFRARVQAAIRGQKQADPCPPVALRPTIRRGASGQLVREMQAALNRHGARLAADSAFGPKTWEALVAFQKRMELLPDGICGPMTWAALLAC